MNAKDYERMGRWSATAQTWLRKACGVMVRAAESEHEPVRDVVAYDAGRMLTTALYDLETLVPLLRESDQYEDAERATRDLLTRLRRHRLASKMRVDGRTAAEAALFREKQAELRR